MDADIPHVGAQGCLARHEKRAGHIL